MILDEIAHRTRARVAGRKQIKPLGKLKQEALFLGSGGGGNFKSALKSDGMSFICEIKKASPSKGVIAEEFPYIEIAKDYEAAGAAAISVLTEPYWFLGSDIYLKDINDVVKTPLLRKDFTVDEYQIYEARNIGASAVLLICAILDLKTLREYLEIASSLGLAAIVEAHTKDEVLMAVDSGAEIIGVNNRDLQTFNVDITTSLRLREFVPEDIIYVSESGIKNAEDIDNLRKNGTDAVLIGEALMKSADKKRELDILRGVSFD